MNEKKKDINSIEDEEVVDGMIVESFFAPSDDESESDMELANLLNKIDIDCSILFK